METRRGVLLLPPSIDYCKNQPWLSESWADCQKLLVASVTILVFLHVHYETSLWSIKKETSYWLVRSWFLNGEIIFLCLLIDFNQPVLLLLLLLRPNREGPSHTLFPPDQWYTCWLCYPQVRDEDEGPLCLDLKWISQSWPHQRGFGDFQLRLSVHIWEEFNRKYVSGLGDGTVGKLLAVWVS